HTLILAGLTPTTEYTVRFVFSDLADIPNETVGPEVTFTTASGPDLPNPNVLELSVRADDRTAQVIATNKKPTNVRIVLLGPDDPSRHIASIGDPDPAATHALFFSNLEPGRKYFIKHSASDHPADHEGHALWHLWSFRTRRSHDVPRVIKGPVVDVVTPTGAQISFETDLPAIAAVEFGMTEQVDRLIPLLLLGTDHTVRLTNLTPGTLYSYRALISPLGGGDTLRTVMSTFRTLEVADTTPPKIPVPPTVTFTPRPGANLIDAEVIWETDEPSSFHLLSKVAGSPEPFVSVDARPDLTSLHSSLLVDLRLNITYSYLIQSTDAAGNRGEAVFRLTTPSTSVPDTVVPTIIGNVVVAGYVSNDRVVLTWATDDPSDSQVFYAEVTSGPERIFEFTSDRVDVTDHRVTLTGLKPNTIYRYIIGSADLAGNWAVWPPGESRPKIIGGRAVVDQALQPPGGDGTFTTLLDPDLQPPALLGPPTVVERTTTSATIAWTTDEFSDSVVEFGLAPSPESSAKLVAEPVLPFKRELATDLTEHRVSISNLSPGTTYVYRVSSTDPGDNGPSTSPVAIFTTTTEDDVTPPVISDLRIVSTTDRQAVVVWTTDEPATGIVEFGTSSEIFIGLRQETDRQRSHVVTLTNLSPSTDYILRVKSLDKNGNLSTPSVVQVTTEAEPDRRPPRIINPPKVVSTVFFRETGLFSATVEWETDEPSNSFVRFGADASLGSRVGSHENVVVHRVSLPSLRPETTYLYQVGSQDAGRNEVRGTLESFFLPEADRLPPSPPAGLSILAGDGLLLLRWQSNLDPDLAGYNLARVSPSGVSFPIATAIVDTVYLDAGLTNGVSVTYRLTAIDRSMNESDGVELRAVPIEGGLPGPPAPVIPAMGMVLSTQTPNLTVVNARRGTLRPDVIPTYSFVVYADPGLTRIVASAAGIPEGAGTTLWHVQPPLDPGTYYWRAQANDGFVPGEWSAVRSFSIAQGSAVEGTEEQRSFLPTTFALLPPSPNPFNAQTAIRYTLPRPSRVTMTVYNVLGRRIRILLDTGYPAGNYVIVWDGNDSHQREVSSGIYFVWMEAEGFHAMRKVALLR
ncbi:MAG: fibronectin type III domain-containing protein, partial [Candidatus Latescibacteria bacterium]|nr:fibronectin type III domain-containing protein [Candidatus Latescibacterota bacterium]